MSRAKAGGDAATDQWPEESEAHYVAQASSLHRASIATSAAGVFRAASFANGSVVQARRLRDVEAWLATLFFNTHHGNALLKTDLPPVFKADLPFLPELRRV